VEGTTNSQPCYHNVWRPWWRRAKKRCVFPGAHQKKKALEKEGGGIASNGYHTGRINCPDCFGADAKQPGASSCLHKPGSKKAPMKGKPRDILNIKKKKQSESNNERKRPVGSAQIWNEC